MRFNPAMLEEFLRSFRNLNIDVPGLTGPAISLLTYVFTALAIFTMAERRGIRNAWLAWIPVANLWVLGSLSDQYRYVVRGEIRSKRKVLLVLSIIKAVLGIAMAVIMGIMLFGLVGDFFAGSSERVVLSHLMGPGVAALVVGVPMAVLGITQTVLYFMALYDIYRSCEPQNATLYLVLSILIGITRPIFLFICRDKEQGMPPRRMEM